MQSSPKNLKQICDFMYNNAKKLEWGKKPWRIMWLRSLKERSTSVGKSCKIYWLRQLWLLSRLPLTLSSNASSDSIYLLSCRTLQPMGYFNWAKTQGMPVILSIFIKVSLYPKEPLRTTCGTERLEPLITCINPKPTTIMIAAAISKTAAVNSGHFIRCFTGLFNIWASEYWWVSGLLLIFSLLFFLSTRTFLSTAGRAVLPLVREGTGINRVLHFVHCTDVDMSKYWRYWTDLHFGQRHLNVFNWNFLFFIAKPCRIQGKPPQ